MAVNQEQIDIINDRLAQLDQGAEILGELIKATSDDDAGEKEELRGELQRLIQEREQLEVKRDTLVDQQQTENSAGGNTAEQATEDDSTNQQALTSDEVDNLESNGSLGETSDAGSESVNGEPTSDEKGKQTDLTVGNDNTDAGKEQKNLSSQTATTKQNKLHQYESYTYRLTLYALTKDELRSLNTNPNKFSPRHVLVSSSGSYASDSNELGRERHPDFQEDFYFENFDFTTIVGMNARSKASNSIIIKFTLVEPYGLTFLDRLLSVAETDPFNCANYLELPYLIEIDFIANPTGSSPAGSKTSNIVDQKRIPIRFTNMKIKPGVEGSVYSIDAIPFNHLAFMNTVAAVPTSVSVVGGTVSEFFADDQSADNKEKNQERAAQEFTELKSSLPFGGSGLSPEAESALRAKIQKQYAVFNRVGSFPAAYNEHYRQVAGDDDNASTFPQTQIKFLIDEEIANSPIVRESETSSSSTPMNNVTDRTNLTVRDGLLSFGKVKQDFPIMAGTNVIQLIDLVIKKSEYIYSQVKEVQEAREIKAQAEKNEDQRSARAAQETLDKYKMLNWYKIVPQVSLGEFDPKRNAYAKEVIYSIKKHKVANAYHPEFEKSRIKKSKITRSYNYLYTGLNQDIIDVDINFDTTYFTSYQVFKGRKDRNAGGKNIARSNTGDRLKKNEQDSKVAGVEKGQVNDQGSTYAIHASSQSQAGQVNRQGESISQVVNDLSDSLYSSQLADMLNIRCKIVGDPAFIKQDDVYYNPASEGYDDYVQSNELDSAPINPVTGDITFDGEQVYVQLLINNIVDIDDSKGIANKGLAGSNGTIIKLTNGRNLNGAFSGVYKVIQVQNSFAGGEFTQTLDLIKMPNDILEVEAATTQSDVVVVLEVEQGDTTTNTGTLTNNVNPGDTDEPGVLAQDIARQVAQLAAAADGPTNPLDADDVPQIFS